MIYVGVSLERSSPITMLDRILCVLSGPVVTRTHSRAAHIIASPEVSCLPFFAYFFQINLNSPRFSKTRRGAGDDPSARSLRPPLPSESPKEKSPVAAAAELLQGLNIPQ